MSHDWVSEKNPDETGYDHKCSICGLKRVRGLKRANMEDWFLYFSASKPFTKEEPDCNSFLMEQILK